MVEEVSEIIKKCCVVDECNLTYEVKLEILHDTGFLLLIQQRSSKLISVTHLNDFRFYNTPTIYKKLFTFNLKSAL